MLKSRFRVPPVAVMAAAVWLWAWLWYGDVLRMARVFSFWSWDPVLTQYMDGRPWELLWRAGQCLLTLFRWPWLGGLALSLLVTGSTWLLGYNLRLRGWWRLLPYLLAAAMLGLMSYVGFDLYFETETGRIMGVPLLCAVTLGVVALIIRSFKRKPRPAEASKWLRRAELAAALLPAAVAMGISHWLRPEVRVVARMQVLVMEQRWKDCAQVGRDNGDLSYRQLAAYYAIALLHRGEIGTRLFDIRMDFDDPYLHGFDGSGNDAQNYYLMDMDYHNGLVQTAIHHAMENMTMNGPNLRALKMLTKCALLTGEWEVAEKYFAVLRRVPFEGDWIAHYEPMLRDSAAIDSDKEFAVLRLTEPTRDVMENIFVQPVFLGYNAALTEGRSINALWNSLAVHIYTKTMPQFIYRCQPMAGTQPPELFAQALALMAGKQPELMQMYQGLDFQRTRLSRFVSDVKPMMSDRPAHARELYPRWRGYYPYYYFFGNLKATKKSDNSGTSNSGVN